ncbi:unnamed protein product [Effrenium voratum]|uniref:MYND-type domain-containing protein n=1 Tax=Effrenium voratum TaxID=2562239 RepID=A0AA36J1Z0_9DINO|nr:unnamed protein product [Effrenium voratum]
MPNAELSSRRCELCDRVGALLQCGSCKQVAYCNFTCQKEAWKAHKKVCGKAAEIKEAADPSPAPEPSWSPTSVPPRALPRPKVVRSSAAPAKFEDFFDRSDLDPGLAPLGTFKAKNSDRLNYSRWDNVDSDDDKPKKPVAPTRTPMYGQPMGMQPARANAEPARVTSSQRHLAKSSLDEAERYLHEVAGEVLNQAGFMGHGSVWELGPAAEKIARKCLRILDAKVLPFLDDVLAKFLHGSASYFLRRAMSARDTEKRTSASDAKAMLLEVYRDPVLVEDYRVNAREFLAALFYEEGQPSKAKQVELGEALDAGAEPEVAVSNGRDATESAKRSQSTSEGYVAQSVNASGTTSRPARTFPEERKENASSVTASRPARTVPEERKENASSVTASRPARTVPEERKENASSVAAGRPARTVPEERKENASSVTAGRPARTVPEESEANSTPVTASKPARTLPGERKENLTENSVQSTQRPKAAQKSIPSIEEVLAMLDREDEEEQDLMY